MDLAELRDSLDPDLLWLVVSGPGYGESIAVRVPPDSWMLVDSYGRADAAPEVPPLETDVVELTPLVRLLNGGQAECVVLTHPHEDHAGGFDRLINRYLDTSRGRVGCVARFRKPAPGYAEGRNWRGAVLASLNRVLNEWQNRDASKLELSRGEVFPLGSAQVTVLHPDDVALEKWDQHIVREKKLTENTLSAALLVEWNGTRLLLGADVDNEGWERVGSEYDDLHHHDAMKIAHHGSLASQHVCFLQSHVDQGQRSWVLTPWTLNHADCLPRYDPRGGVARLLQHQEEVIVTSVGWRPYAHIAQHVHISEVHKAVIPTDMSGRVESVPVYESSPATAWAAFGFDADGKLVARHLGDAARVIYSG